MRRPSSYLRKRNENTSYLSNIGSQGNMSSSTTTSESEKDVGEGFFPTDQQLATHYLKLMLLGYYCLASKIPVIDIYEYEPWDVPYVSGLSLSSPEWYFFCPRRDKNRSRTSRLTKGGFWKSTGQDRVIEDETDGLMFKKKSLVYHKGRSKDRGNGTKWTIYEIRATLGDGTTQGDYVICILFENSIKKKAKVPTKSGGEPSRRRASELGHLLAVGNPNFPAQASYEGNSNFPLQPPVKVAVGPQSQASFMCYNEQGYGLNPTLESNVTPNLETAQFLVFDYGDRL